MKSQPTGFSIIRETVLNVLSNPARSAITVIAAAAAGACVILATVSNVDDIVRAHQLQLARGLSTLSVTALDGHPMSAAACDAMNSVAAVKTAGGVISTEQVEVANGATPIKVEYVTAGYFAAAYPTEATKGIQSIAGEDLVGEVGAAAGSVLAITTPESIRGLLSLDAVADAPSRVTGINRDVLVTVAPIGSVSECLVEAYDGQADDVALVVPSFFTGPVVVRPFLPTGTLDRDPAQELAHRYSGLLWLGAGAVIIALIATSWFARRQETAIYRLVGFDRRSLGAVVGLETVVTTVVPAQLASLWVMSFTKISGGIITLTALTSDSSRLLVMLLFCPAVAVAVSLSGSTVNRLKGQ
jgi:hypothetical protein